MRLITHHTVPICSKNMRRSLAEMVYLTIAMSLISSIIHRGFQRLFRIVSPCVTLVIVSSPPRNTIGASRSRAYMNSSGQPTVSTLICLPNNESANLPFQALAARSLRSLQHTCSGRVSSVAHFISIQHTNSTTTPRRPPAYMHICKFVCISTNLPVARVIPGAAACTCRHQVCPTISNPRGRLLSPRMFSGLLQQASLSLRPLSCSI
jgi:hypothetical protein